MFKLLSIIFVSLLSFDSMAVDSVQTGNVISAEKMNQLIDKINKYETYEYFVLKDIDTEQYLGTGNVPTVSGGYIKFILSGVSGTYGNIVKTDTASTLFSINNNDGYTKITALKDILISGNINIVPNSPDAYMALNTNSSIFTNFTKTCSHAGHWCVMQINNFYLKAGEYMRFYSESSLQKYQGLNLMVREK